MACSMAWRQALPVLAPLLCWSALHAVLGSVTFHSGGLNSTVLYSPSATMFIGPQPGDNAGPITRPVDVYHGDLCDFDTPAVTSLADRIVLADVQRLVSASCSYETIFYNLQSRGAAGILLPRRLGVPGIFMFHHDGSRGALARSSKTMFLEIHPTLDEYQAMADLAPNLNATMFSDTNVWGPMYSSWRYQVFVRILPSAILIGSGLLAMMFVVQHSAIMHERFVETVPAKHRTCRRCLRFFINTADLPYVALHIEMVTATLAGVILAVGGLWGDDTLPASVTGFFITLLGGWSMDCSLVSARLWAKKLGDIMPGRQPSLFDRIIQGDYPAISVMLYLVPVVFDTAFSTCLAMNIQSPLILLGGAAISIQLQVAVSMNVIVGVVRFYRTVNVLHRTVGNAVHQGHASVDMLMKRLSRCALGLALSMIMAGAGTVILALLPGFAYTPEGYLLAAALYCNGRALDTAFRVLMFQPRQADAPTAVNEPPGATAPPIIFVAFAKRTAAISGPD